MMKVIDFNVEKGIYDFQLDELDTVFHAHPAVEIVMVSKGKLTLETTCAVYRDVTFAIISANTVHRIYSDDCTARILLLESHNSHLSDVFEQNGYEFSEGVLVQKEKSVDIENLEKLKTFALENDLKTTPDDRIQKCLNLMADRALEYDKAMKILTSRVFLSESRLSHLFKERIGISIKKYLVWTKLKNAVYLMLNQDINLTETAHQVGFFDQAHLSNAFKRMLGMTPNKAYNSRTIQF